MKRAYDRCPGVVTGKLPVSENDEGYFIIEPACSREAVRFLRRRFHVSGEAGIEATGELRLVVIPRVRRAGVARKLRMDFGKPIQQFEFTWTA